MADPRQHLPELLISSPRMAKKPNINTDACIVSTTLSENTFRFLRDSHPRKHFVRSKDGAYYSDGVKEGLRQKLLGCVLDMAL